MPPLIIKYGSQPVKLLFICILLVTGCEKESPTEPQFNSFGDELETWLPEGEAHEPHWNGIMVTMEHLATHSSGIPKSPRDSNQPLPPGYDPYDPDALTGVIILCNQSFAGPIIRFGEDLLKAVNKY